MRTWLGQTFPDGTMGRVVLGAAHFLSGACLVIGIIGLFVTGFDYYSNVTGVDLLGFTVNPNTNVIHIIVGLVGIGLGTSAVRARIFLLLCGLLGIPWAITGYIVEGTMSDFFGRNPTLVTTHLVASTIALALALATGGFRLSTGRGAQGADGSAGLASTESSR